MHRFTDTYTISYTTTFQFFVYQGFSHHLPITQTSYTLLQTYTFVQHSTQTYNRYSYALNNPLRYRDPSGEFIFTLAALIAAPLTGGASLSLLPAAIGADFGMWQGGTLANGTTNPFKWDYSSGKTWSYMLAGAAVGAASGYIGGEVAASGMPFANTMAMVAGSVVNSMGTALYTNLQTDVTISFGAGSFNVSNGTVSGLWDWGNLSKGEKMGYILGALGNVRDIYQFGQNNIVMRRSEEKGRTTLNDDENEIYDKWDRERKTKAWYKNYFGPSGGDANPELLKGKGIIPVNALDAAAYNHDVAYYQLGANGIVGTIFSTNTLNADVQLVKSAASIFIKNYMRFFLSGEVRWALGTSTLFSIISVSKVLPPYAYYFYLIR